MNRVRVAVVGLGGIAQSVHLPLLTRRWDLFEIAAVVDLSQSRTDAIGTRYGVAPSCRFSSLPALLAARDAGTVAVDGAVLATTGSHAPEVAALLAAGVPVLSEKPLALSLAEIDVLESDARSAGRDLSTHLMIGYMKEHDPATARALQELAGVRLRAVTVEVLHPADSAQLHFARLLPPPEDVDDETLASLVRRTARTVEEAVGAVSADVRALYTDVLLGSVVHTISLLRHLVGGVETVAHAVHRGPLPGSLDLLGTVRGGAGLHLGWHYLPDHPDYRETVTFHHEAGSVQLVFSVPYLLNVPTELTVVSRPGDTGDGGAPGELRATYRCPQHEAFENELIAFHAMVTAGTPSTSGLEQGRADLEVAQRVLAAVAASAGQAVGGEAGRL